MNTIKINGKAWIVNLESKLPEDTSGECTQLTKEFGGTLDIGKNQVGWELIDTIIHEWLHALLPHAKESWVNKEASSLATLLTTPEVITKIGLFNNIQVLPKGTQNEQIVDRSGDRNPTCPITRRKIYSRTERVFTEPYERFLAEEGEENNEGAYKTSSS